METTTKYKQTAKINWYRCHVDKAAMSELMQTSDRLGFLQVLLQLGLFAATGTAAYLAYRNIHAGNWWWSMPVMLAALFVHGTGGAFLGYVPIHELSHKTPFRTKKWNEFFLKVYSFLSWSDPIWFRPSHIKHHQLTVHQAYDGEVILPMTLSIKDWKFWLDQFAWNPLVTWDALRQHACWATGHIVGRTASDDEWYRFVLPASNEKLQREHRNWARFVLLGHLAVAAAFVLTGHCFLIVVFTMGSQYCRWLLTLCGTPQHFGMAPNVSDFRLCCRTYTCSRLTGFFYWNMQYHVEHHMFPAVPFFNLPKLRKLVEHDLPPAPHGLRATWKHIMEIHRKQRTDPNYCYVPPLPQLTGDYAEDDVLEREAGLQI